MPKNQTGGGLTEAERRFARYIHEISASPPSRALIFLRSAAIATLFAGAAAGAAYCGFGFAPRPPAGGANLATMAFFPAIIAARRFGGSSASWVAAIILILVECLDLPPQGYLWISAEFMPWFVEFTLAACSTAFLAGPIGRKPHAPNQSVGQGERLGHVRKRFSALFALREDVVKQSRSPAHRVSPIFEPARHLPLGR